MRPSVFVHAAPSIFEIALTHTIRVHCKCCKIVEIRGQGGAIGLRERHHEGVDGRTATRSSAQKRSAPRQRFGNLIHDIARLQEAVSKRVATSMTVQTLDEDDGWNHGRPETLLPQGKDERGRLPGAFGKPADAAGIENEHAP